MDVHPAPYFLHAEGPRKTEYSGSSFRCVYSIKTYIWHERCKLKKKCAQINSSLYMSICQPYSLTSEHRIMRPVSRSMGECLFVVHSTNYDSSQNNTKVRNVITTIDGNSCILTTSRLASQPLRTVAAPLARLSPGRFPNRALSFTSAHVGVPQINASQVGLAGDSGHVGAIAAQLEAEGILKINLGFQDPNSGYLEQMLASLHKFHNHRLPIAHSATRGWFWDVRPAKTGSQQARSETMEEFPWHTDCSYEDPPPRYFALHVLAADRFGGGTLSVVPVHRVVEGLDDATVAQLMLPDYRIRIPAEFLKRAECRHIDKPLLLQSATKAGAVMMRFRADIVTPLNATAARALEDLQKQLKCKAADAAIHLTADRLPSNSIILMDNRRWLHARNAVTDPHRHLRRVRWDAAPVW